jgi:predicted lipase
VAQTRRPNVEQTAQNNTDELFDYDGNLQTGGENRDDSPETKLTPPTVPYDRQISQLLLLCTLLAVEQYQESKDNSNYDGAIKSLPSYSSQLDRYSQIAAFDSLQASPNPLGDVGEFFDRLFAARQRRRVFMGFALTSPQNNIIAFRGTMNATEWLGNLRARQSDFVRNGVSRGRVHRGFLELYERLNEQILKAARQFDSNVPCYITGHSLGGALGALAAADIALNVPQLKNQLQLYTYASPRVGDPTFAQFHSNLVPNSYRVVNLADTVPLVPPSRSRNLRYIHIGQEWRYLVQTGDMEPNHSIMLYQAALGKGVETNQPNAFSSL